MSGVYKIGEPEGALGMSEGKPEWSLLALFGDGPADSFATSCQVA